MTIKRVWGQITAVLGQFSGNCGSVADMTRQPRGVDPGAF